jgi:hypothetical protein
VNEQNYRTYSRCTQVLDDTLKLCIGRGSLIQEQIMMNTLRLGMKFIPASIPEEGLANQYINISRKEVCQLLRMYEQFLTKLSIIGSNRCNQYLLK